MIYFDAAATTFRKPTAVSRAVVQAMQCMTTPGRGDYPAAKRAADTLFQCRSAAAQLFQVDSEENVVFTMNATHALNIAIKSLVHPGDTVVVSGYEHNAVMRPLYAIGGVSVKIASAALFDREALAEEFLRLITPEVKAVICTHVSNVFGMILPIERIAAICQKRNVPLIVDASQSAGVLPITLRATGAAFIAMPGHKGLYGPQGTGLLLCGRGLPQPLMEGGTGSLSIQREMPEYLPDRLEAGTQNVPGIAGLLEGLRFISGTGTETIAGHERFLLHELVLGLREMPEVRLFYAENGAQTGVLSFLVAGMACETVAAYLARRDIAVRAGLHCAPLAHQSAGTLQTGTVRLSLSAFNTEQEVRIFLSVLKELLAGKGT